MSFTNFEHELLKVFKNKYKDLNDVWVSCSFGVDSLVLLDSLRRLNPILKLNLQVIHIHHGKSDSSDELTSYRDEALEKTREYCKKNELTFKSFVSAKPLHSEEEYRDYRLSCYKELDDEKSANILLGQHKQDHLETLMLKLIRGVGPQGFKFDDLETKDFNLFRPLISFSKEDILLQAKHSELDYVEDPTNKRDDFLRNWIRNKWLKDLEGKRAGSLNSLSESLSLLSESVNVAYSHVESNFLDQSEHVLESTKISQQFWLSLGSEKKNALIAQILNKYSDKSFSKGQINEVIKQLDLLKKEHRFNIAGLMWKKDIKSITFKKD